MKQNCCQSIFEKSRVQVVSLFQPKLYTYLVQIRAGTWKYVITRLVFSRPRAIENISNRGKLSQFVRVIEAIIPISQTLLINKQGVAKIFLRDSTSTCGLHKEINKIL